MTGRSFKAGRTARQQLSHVLLKYTGRALPDIAMVGNAHPTSSYVAIFIRSLLFVGRALLAISERCALPTLPAYLLGIDIHLQPQLQRRQVPELAALQPGMPLLGRLE